MKERVLIIAGILVFVFVFSMPGCGKKEEPALPPKEEAVEIENDDPTSHIDEALQQAAQYLVAQMNEKGVISIKHEDKAVPSAGITALSVVALTKLKKKYDPVKKAIAKGADFLASLKKEDGGIYMDPKAAPPTYVTAVAILALSSIDKEKYKDIIKGGQDYLAGKFR